MRIALHIAIFSFTLLIIACQNGGSLSLESNALLVGQRAKAIGSCMVLQQALVLSDGYCTEFYRTLPMTDAPGMECQQAGGVWSISSCARATNLVGRCFLKSSGDINLVYFAGTANGASRCQAAVNSLWQAGSSL